MRKRIYGLMGVLATFLSLATLSSVYATGETEKGATEEVLTISWLSRINSSEGRSWALEYVNEMFNVNIVPYGIDTNDRDKVNLMLAAGEFPDCGNVNDEPIKLYNEGIIRSIPLDMIRNYAPSYARRLDQDHPLGWLMNKTPDAEDECLGIKPIMANIDVANEVACVRVDWARNVGMELPAYEEKKIPLDRFGRVHYLDEPITLEWLERLLIAIRDGDPDGNGKVDTIPWGGNSNIVLTWSPIMGAFRVGYGFNLMHDGKFYEWNIAPNYKEFLKLAARWYKLGILDNEFVNLSHSKAWERVASGLVAACTGRHVWTGRYRFTNRPPNSFSTDEEAAKGAEVAVFLPVGPDGQQGSLCGSVGGPFSTGHGNFMIKWGVDDTKLAKILEIVDYIRYGGEEGWVYAERGKLGVHFDWEKDPWTSMPIQRDFENVPNGYPEQGYFPTVYPPCYSRDRFKFLLPTDLAAFWDSFQYSPEGQELAVRPYKYDLLNQTEYTELKIKYGDTLNTIALEFYFKAVTGGIDIDAEWDGYVMQWRKSGGDLLMAELEKSPILEELLKGKIVY